MNITVAVSPVITLAISGQGANLVLTWNGRQPPYSVQMATNLPSPAWQTIAGPMTNTTWQVTPTNSLTFYRIEAQ